MKVELHLNGRISIILIPESTIERTIIAEMISHAGKGKAVMLMADAGTNEADGVSGAAVVSVEK